MPVSVHAEEFILGSILLDDARFSDVAAALTGDSFGIDKHRRIWERMQDLHARGEKIDRGTVANELLRFNELESIGGLTTLVSLDDGLPHVSNIDSYVRIVRDKATLRRLAFSGQALMNRALLGEEDPADIVAGFQEQFQSFQVRETGGLRSPREIIQDYEGGINALLDPSKRTKGFSTGFTRFDELTGGLRPGELTILAARPSMGKTALALNIAWHVASRLFQPVAVFSLEMSEESLLTRMLCAAARVDSQRFRAGYLNEGERNKLRQAANQMVEAPLYIDDSAGVTVLEIGAKLRRFKQRNDGKLGLVIVDYLQLMSTRMKSENRTQEVSAMSRGLKLLSKELDCPFLVLSQLSRATETRTGDHRPQLSDLRESGSIEQDADIVAFIFREEVYKRDREDLRGIAELILGKQRNGPIGTVQLIFLHAQTRFENRAEDLGEPDDSRLPYSDD